ncbi:MAG TPA: DUF2254 domain-containing protein [Miltoncostaeaceae bacterium]|nr:DUF2254 domain-containing protein [Miltoncostaeaceae bacterium]
MRWNLREKLSSSLWFWPGAGGALGLLLSAVLVRLDRRVDLNNSNLVFGGDAGAARAVLETVAGTTMTVLGVILTLTLAVLTLTANAYSPRVLRTLVRDRLVKAVTAAFVGTFAFSLNALRLVREDRVPGITVSTAVALSFVALGLLVALFHRLSNRIRVESIVAEVHEEALAAVAGLPRADDEASTPPPPPPDGGAAVVSRRTGRVQRIDDESLLERAVARGRSVYVRVAPGEFVVTGQEIARVTGDAPLDDDDEEAVREAVSIDRERTATGDPTFPLRQLIDIALRALSPGIQDPTTAHEALTRAGDMLRALADRELGPRTRRRHGLAVTRPGPDWDGCVSIVFDQARRTCAQQADVATLAVLMRIAGVLLAQIEGARRAALERQVRLMRDAAVRVVPDGEDRRDLEAEAARVLAARPSDPARPPAPAPPLREGDRVRA